MNITEESDWDIIAKDLAKENHVKDDNNSMAFENDVTPGAACCCQLELSALSKDLDQLSRFYPMMVNIKNQLNCASINIIDGDGLLLACLNDNNLTWDKGSGGQYLHFTYIVERQLQIFLQYPGQFKILFFKEAGRVLWCCSPSVQLFREVLILHLKKYMPIEIEVITDFFNPWDVGFLKYVQVNKPDYVFTCDILEDEEEDEEVDVGITLLHLELVRFLELGLNLAFLDDLLVTGSALNCFCVNNVIVRKDFVKYMREKLKLDKIIYDVDCVANELPEWSSFKDFKGIRIECFTMLFFMKTYFNSSKEEEREDLKDFVKLFLFYVLMKEKLPLKKRALPEVSNGSKKLLTFIKNMQLSLQTILIAASPYSVEKKIEIHQNLCDLWDGNLFMNVILFIWKHKNSGFQMLDAELKKAWFHMVNKFGIDSQFPREEILDELKDTLTLSENNSEEVFPSTELVFVKSELMKSYAEDILDEINFIPEDDWRIDDFVSDYDKFKDLYHWHCNKFVINDHDELKNLAKELSKTNAIDGDDDDDSDDDDDVSDRKEDKNKLLPDLTKKQMKTMTEIEILNYKRGQRRLRKRLDRRKYHLQRYLQIYGESLGERKHTVNIVAYKEKKEKRKKQIHHNQKNTAKGKNQTLAVIEKEKLKKTKESEEENMKEISNLVRNLQAKRKYKEIVDQIKIREKMFETKEGKFVWCIKLVGAYEACLKHSIDLKEKEDLIKETFLCIRNIQFQYEKMLSMEDKRIISSCLDKMGFLNLQAQLNQNDLVENQKEDERNESGGNCHIVYQLQQIGHLLPRNIEMEPDDRVTNFIPDKWQRELFDAIDHNQSALVVAPTSSGKTYASYYCMEKILRNNDEDVVVYVSPTKALVNQVRAYIYNKFNKPNLQNGKVVCGVFTRDFRDDVSNCQILVTVPQCLEILLLSPDSFEWSKKIKYVIFDEIHCLGAENGGEVWEHLLTLISSPFLALSATIKNLDALHRWLQTAQDYQKNNKDMFYRRREDCSYTVNKVLVHFRHSDLESYIFNPDVKSLEEIHPYSVLHYGRIKDKGIPAQVSLSSNECLQLSKAMKDLCSEREEFQKLQPSVYFKEASFLMRDDVRRFETDLKHEVQNWMLECGDSQTKFESLQKKLSSAESSMPIVKKEELVSNFVNLLNHLKEKDMFPVIVFCFDRHKCQTLVEEVVGYFEDNEKKYFASKKEKGKSTYEKNMEKKERDKNSHPDDEKATEMRNEWLEHQFCPKNGSFAGKGVVTKEDTEYLYARFINNYPRRKSYDILRKGIRYGIGFHHGGLNNVLRSTVEILFRKKFLNVIVATATLAVGIHVPCRSVVITEHNVYLDVLNFRQMAGRSGRRGFDMVGNVIFHEVPKPIVSKLLSAELPSLQGNFPMSVTLCLRLMIIVEEVRLKGKESEEAKKDTIARVLTLLKNPLMLQQMPHLERQFKYFFVFSVQFLVREGMLKLDGKPQGLAGVASHLFYHEPFNYAFVACIHAGTFHEFCETENAYTREGKKLIFTEAFLRDLVMVLSHFFARRKLHPRLLKRRGTSIIELPDLLPSFQNEIVNYNCRVERMYNIYLQSISNHAELIKGEDIELPLSKLKFLSTKDTAMPKSNIIGNEIYKAARDNNCCSSFSALSGNNDNIKLYKITDRITNVRHQVYTDVHEIPLIPTDISLNSYVLDFFKHGNTKAIIMENGLKGGEDFSLLKDFGLVVATIACSMELFAPRDDIVRKAFRQLADVYDSKFTEAYYY